MYKSCDGQYIYLFIYFTVHFYQRIAPTKISLNMNKNPTDARVCSK